MSNVTHANGLPSPLGTDKASSTSSPPRVVLSGKTGRILCVADIRGDYHELNRLIREHEATAVIHTGDFGFINAESLERMGDKILRHLLQYSPLIPPATRTQLLDIPPSEGRAALIDALNKSSIHFPLSQFPHLLSGAITFPVPVFTVWGLIEDVRVLEKFRTSEYDVHNLHIVDEATSRVIDVGGVKLRLFGLGGAVATHKLFDNGEGFASIAGGQGTMWATALQMGELVDTASRVYDPTETRMFISSAPISRNGTLAQISRAVNADLTVSAGLHFRYPAVFNEFSVTPDFESYRHKLENARDTFLAVYNSVKDRVDSSLTEQQLGLLKKALAVVQKVPEFEDGTWTNTWNWVLSDAACGHVLFSITDGRVSAETKSTGLNFSHRSASQPAPPSRPLPAANVVVPPARGPAPDLPVKAPAVTPSRPPVSTATVPPKPPAAQTAQAQGMGNIRGIMPRPVGQAGPLPAKPPLQNAATAAGSSSTPTPAAGIPPKGPQITRQPRGPANIAGQSVGGMGAGKDKVEPRGPAGRERVPSSVPKSTTPGAGQPTANGKSPAPSKSTIEDRSKDKDQDKKPAPAAATSTSAPNGPSSVNKSESKPSTPAAEDAKEVGKEGLERPTSGAGSKRPSLYIKGIPLPTSDEELRGLFGSAADKASRSTRMERDDGLTAEQITNVKIITDFQTKKQKDFAYVDFANEEDLQAALKANSGTIRETAVKVEVSNPPRSFPDAFRGGRGRGSFRGARGGARGGFAGAGGVREKKEGGSPAPGGGAEGKKEAAPVATGGEKKE